MLGVLFETGSGKYLKLIEDNAQFHSSYQNASIIDFMDWREQDYKFALLDHHNVDWYVRTIRWLPLINGKPDHRYLTEDFSL
jgi:hypothetical protein